MKITVIPILICLLCIKSFGQTTIFNADGKLIKLEHGTPDIKSENAALAELNNMARKDARELLQKKILQTLSAISKPNSSSNRFYNNIWPGEITDIINDLTYIKDLLSETNDSDFLRKYDISRILKLKTTAKCIAQNVYGIDAYTIDRTKKNKVVLTQKNLLNSFLVELYNQTLPDLDADLSISNYFDVCKIITNKKNIVDSILKQYKNELRKGTEYNLYCNIQDYQKEFNNFKENSAVSKILKSNWGKEWFWLRGGESKLNPLDFTTDTYVKNIPEFDIVNAALFNQYIDTLIARHIRSDSVQKIDEFNKLLSLRNNGKDVYSFKGRIDSLLARNEASRNVLLNTSTDLNVIEIPQNDSFYAFSVDLGIKFNNSEKNMKAPLHTSETKTIAVYNIGADVKVNIIETDKSIIDRSTFQEFSDTTFSYLGQIGKIVLSLNPYIGMLSNLSVAGPVNSVISANKVTESNPSSRGGTLGYFKITIFGKSKKIADDDNACNKIKKYIKDELTNHCAFDQTIFDEVYVSFCENISEKKIITCFNKYYSIYNNKLLDQLITDSLLTANFVNFYINSTIPQTSTLEPQKAPTVRYSSKILYTKSSDDPVKKEVSIYGLKNKDTVWIEKFSYKVGRNYRFQLSAGVAYTFGNYSQSKADIVNGKISISNNVQQYRFIAGIHVYPFKGLYLQDNRFFGKPAERVSIFAGVGIPDPLGNLYTGVSYDLWPGFKLSSGLNIIKQNKYSIENDLITENRLHYKAAGIFAALQIDPTSLVNMLGSFNKK